MGVRQARPALGAWAGLVGERAARELVEQALRLSTAGETEAVLTTTSEALTRFAHNTIHQNVAEVDAELEVRAATGRRGGVASTNDLSPAGVERAVARACEQTQHLPANPDWPGLPTLADVDAGAQAPVQAFDEAVAGASPELRARTIREICAAARGPL